MRIIGYTYEADYHCPDCAETRFTGQREVDGHLGEYLDECGVPFDAKDAHGENVSPIFSTDEVEDGSSCSECSTLIKH